MDETFFVLVRIMGKISENSVFIGQNKGTNARGAPQKRRSLPVKKALARGRKFGPLTHFCAEKFVDEITHTFFYKMLKFQGNMLSNSRVIEENVSGHLSVRMLPQG